ncbi:unnamed protein product [Spirodela intermedia]|uniref:Uncharacterized protein n=1 Tax=Spirodela intermedia TaxID=51605 RepID=A0A7I8JJZ9_SPIIN|nr:unnamed protein product [Spirodela intermedia]CAA6670507.1 unnamed protein product [Spirodela intermedia]
MQGQRSTVESLPEAFEFDHSPGSSTSAIEQQIYWTNVLNPTDVQTLPGYLISPSEANMPYDSEVNHEIEGSKMESGCMFSSAAGARGGLRLEERRLDTARVLSLDVGINLNRTHVAEDQVFLQNSSSDAAALNIGCDASSAGGGGLVSQTGICPLYNPYIPQAEQVTSTSGSSNPCGTSCRVAGNLCESSGGRLGSSLEGRRLSGKRKSMEGDSGQSSGSGSHVCFQQTENGLLHNVSARNVSSSGLNVSTTLENLTGVNAHEEHLSSRYNAAGTRGEPSECRSSINVEENAESSHGNFRMRINRSLAHQADASAPDWQPSLNSSRQPTIWSPHQSSSLIPGNQSLEARLTTPSTNSQGQPQQLSVHGFPRLVLPLTRNGIPEASHFKRGIKFSGTRRNNTSEHPMFGSTTEPRVVAQLPVDWSLASSNLNISGTLPSSSHVGSSSGAHPSITPRVHYQNLPAQHPRSLSEFVPRAFPTAESDPGVQLNNMLPQLGLRSHPHPLLRSAFLMDRRSGVMGAPLALRTLAASREGRSRMISELHIEMLATSLLETLPLLRSQFNEQCSCFDGSHATVPMGDPLFSMA